MTTPDFPDWAQPVGVIDRAAVIGAGVQTIHNNQSTAALDTSRYNSIGLQITPPSTFASHRYLLNAAWSEAGHVIDNDTLTFHDSASWISQQMAPLFWHLPVRGDSVTISCLGDDNANITFWLIGSTRQLNGDAPTVSNSQPGRQLLTASFGVVAAGTTTSVVYTPPAARAVLVRLNQKASNVQVNVTAVSGVGTGIGGVSAPVIFGTDPTNAGVAYEVPACGLELSITNADTSNHTCTLNVLDAS